MVYPSLLQSAEDVCFVRAGMGSEDGGFVKVVGVCTIPAGVICGKAEGVKVLDY